MSSFNGSYPGVHETREVREASSWGGDVRCIHTKPKYLKALNMYCSLYQQQ
jgi:hypothetical protein